MCNLVWYQLLQPCNTLYTVWYSLTVQGVACLWIHWHCESLNWCHKSAPRAIELPPLPPNNPLVTGIPGTIWVWRVKGFSFLFLLWLFLTFLSSPFFLAHSPACCTETLFQSLKSLEGCQPSKVIQSLIWKGLIRCIQYCWRCVCVCVFACAHVCVCLG